MFAGVNGGREDDGRWTADDGDAPPPADAEGRPHPRVADDVRPLSQGERGGLGEGRARLRRAGHGMPCPYMGCGLLGWIRVEAMFVGSGAVGANLVAF